MLYLLHFLSPAFHDGMAVIRPDVIYVIVWFLLTGHEICFTWGLYVFFGIAAPGNISLMFGSLFVEKIFPENVKRYIRLFTDIVTIVFMILCTYFGMVLVQRIIHSGQISPALHLPMFLLYGVIPVSSVLSIIQILLQIFRHKSYNQPME